MTFISDEGVEPTRSAHASEGNSEPNTAIADIEQRHRRHLLVEASLIEHTQGLFTFAVALTNNLFDAEDLVQETYVRAVGAIGRLREESNVRAWLFTILRNLRLNQLRQQRTRPKLPELGAVENNADFLVDSAEDPHALLERTSETEQVRKALLQLSHDSRTIILMREYSGLSYHEIASILNCPPGTVMSRLARARAKLGMLLNRIRHSPNQRYGQAASK